MTMDWISYPILMEVVHNYHGLISYSIRMEVVLDDNELDIICNS